MWFTIVAISTFCVLILAVGIFGIPRFFVKLLPIAVALISVIAMTVSIILESYGPIGFAIVVILVSVFYFFFGATSSQYTGVVLAHIQKRFLSWHILASLFVALIVISFLAVFFGYFIWFVLIAQFSGALYAVALVFFWLTVRVFGEVIYQIVSHFAAINCFARGHSDFHGNIEPLNAIRRALFQNFGIACFNGIILPLVGPFYSCAHVTAEDLAVRLEFLPGGLGKIIARLYGCIHVRAVSTCMELDKRFEWPERRGSVYSAVYGVPRVEGCRRIAENAAMKYARVLDRLCCVDNLLGFAGLGMETVAGFLAWAVAGRLFHADDASEIDDWAVRRIVGALGFFTAFAVLHILRLTVGGLVDTLFVCCVEGWSKLHDPDFTDFLEAQYIGAIRRAPISQEN
jgi:hypothetical protein